MKRALLLLTLIVSCSRSLLAQQGPDFSGVWTVSDVTYAPWIFRLTQNGTTLTGSVQQSGGLPGVSQIFEGVVTGNAVSFKARSGDGARTITFAGTLSQDSIAFKRTVENVRPSISGAGVFGASGAAEFTARRREGSTPSPSARIPDLPVVGANFSGTWQTTDIPGGPWVFEFTPSGTIVTGTVRQIAPQPNPMSLAAGRIDAATLSFRVLSPDGERIINFRGQLNGNEISFVRDVDVLAEGTQGDNDLYGSTAPMRFVARRILAR
jgi:hypothetical protein